MLLQDQQNQFRQASTFDFLHVNFNLLSTFSKRNQYLIDPFVRPSICCLIIAVVFLFAGGVGIKLYQFYMVNILVWFTEIKITSARRYYTNYINSVDCSFIGIDHCWYFMVSSQSKYSKKINAPIINTCNSLSKSGLK